jgi:hypothetical protein
VDPDWIRIGSGFSDFVDPDPYWVGIRIQGQENEEISVEKCTFLLFKKKLPLKGIK